MAPRVLVGMPSRKAVPLSPEQAAAFQYLLDHQETVLQNLLERLFEDYPEWQEEVWNNDEADSLVPALERPEQLKTLMRFANIHVLHASKEGLAYLGFEFDCTWEEEHGAGVMTHKERIVAAGGADSAFLDWIAENDARSAPDQYPH